MEKLKFYLKKIEEHKEKMFIGSIVVMVILVLMYLLSIIWFPSWIIFKVFVSLILVTFAAFCTFGLMLD